MNTLIWKLDRIVPLVLPLIASSRTVRIAEQNWPHEQKNPDKAVKQEEMGANGKDEKGAQPQCKSSDRNMREVIYIARVDTYFPLLV